jgi:hypothetical protein
MNMRIVRVAAIVFGLLFVLTGIAFVLSGAPLHEQKLVRGSYSMLRIIFGEQWGRYVFANSSASGYAAGFKRLDSVGASRN